MKILLAENNPATRFALHKNLMEWGYHVIEAQDGDEAWTALSTEDPPAIALLDWLMPGLDGVELCRRLATRHDLTYAILLTGKSNRNDQVYALDQGAHDFLSKPVAAEALRSRLAVGRRLVERYLEHRRVLSDLADELRRPAEAVVGLAESLAAGSAGPVTEKQIALIHSIRTAGRELRAGTHRLYHTGVEGALSMQQPVSAEPVAQPSGSDAGPVASPPPGSAQVSDVVLDLEPITNLLGRDGELLEEFFETLLDDLPNALERIDRRVGDRDFEAVQHLAHDIRGSAIGAPQLIGLAQDLEQAARRKNADGCRALLPHLNHALNRLQGAVERREWATPEDPILDRHEIIRLVGEESDAIQEFVSICLADLADQIDKLDEHLKDRDLARIQQCAFEVVGASVGGPQLRRLARELEQVADSGAETLCQKKARQLRDAFAAYREALRGEVQARTEPISGGSGPPGSVD